MIVFYRGVYMKRYLYHGSSVPGITELYANSRSAERENKVLYLTDNYPYSLFYIWDSKHNLKKGKHITCAVKNGIVYYEEQFEDQLQRFYDGVSGYVYVVNDSEDYMKVSSSKSIWLSDKNVFVSDVKFIPNVYEEIKKQIAKGKIKIIKHSDVDKDKIKGLYDYISKLIIKNNLLDVPESEQAMFYKTFFPQAWESAMKQLQ